MSLLLEALKRAEDDARKRRVFADSIAAPLDGIEDDESQLAVQGGRVIPRVGASRPGPLEGAAPASSQTAARAEDKGLPDLYFPELSLVAEERGHEPPQLEEPPAAAPPLRERQPETPERTPVRDGPPMGAAAAAPGPATAPMPSPTPRQAKAAINAMMAKPGEASPPPRANRRTVVLAVLALLLLVPLALLFLWGDSLTGSAPVVARSGVVTPLPVPVAAAPLSTPAPDAISTTVAAVPAEGAAAAAAPATQTPAVQVPAENPAPSKPQRATAKPSDQPKAVAAAPAAARSAPAPAPAPAAAAVALKPGVARLDTLLASAYASFQAGRNDEAEAAYRSILTADPTQRDAWLGVAVIAHAAKRSAEAVDAYKQVLRLDPQNGTALTGLSNLDRSAHAPAEESRLRELLAAAPQSAELNHALGLLMAGEARWSEAQALFFRAHALGPTEPQFAFNLAVALDRLRKPDLARRYYGTALELAEGRRAGFDVPATRARLAALTGSAGTAATKAP